jgi:peptidoglycan/xylan/chitin deacetylase (PgdA/CDA1 family)
MPFRKLILMYHAIASTDHPAVMGSHPVSMERFKAQMTGAREQGWRFGAISRLFEPIEGDTLYVTGDDGTIDWFRNVLPWCEASGIPTHTAIITGPWARPPVYPIAHRLQIMLCLSGYQLPIPDLAPEQLEYVDRVYAYETDPRRRRLKGACNVILTDEQARALLGPPKAEEMEWLSRRFAMPEDYRPLKLAELGTHTVTHNAFSGDPQAYVDNEIMPCFRTLQEHGFSPTRVFTLPMRPRHPATVEQLIPALKQAGFLGVLDGQGQWDQQNFIIPRIDAKNVEQVLGLDAWRGD